MMNEEDEAYVDKTLLDLPLAILTTHVTPYSLAIVDFLQSSEHAMLSLLGLSTCYSLCLKHSAPLHACLSSHPTPACWTPW